MPGMNVNDLTNEFLNYKYNMTVQELQTSVGLLKENYVRSVSYQTLTEIEQLLNLLIEKDPDHKDEYQEDLVEVKCEQEHTVFNNSRLYADKIHTNALNRKVEEYIEECIPSSYCSVLDSYIFEEIN
jgi:hypothetical protein